MIISHHGDTLDRFWDDLWPNQRNCLVEGFFWERKTLHKPYGCVQSLEHAYTYLSHAYAYLNNTYAALSIHTHRKVM